MLRRIDATGGRELVVGRLEVEPGLAVEARDPGEAGGIGAHRERVVGAGEKGACLGGRPAAVLEEAERGGREGRWEEQEQDGASGSPEHRPASLSPPGSAKMQL